MFLKCFCLWCSRFSLFTVDETCFVLFLKILISLVLSRNFKDINKTEKQLNEDFENICHWFVDKKLSIHFDDDKPRSIFFATKFKIKKVRKLNIRYGDTQTKQHSKVKNLGCIVDETMSGETMTLFVINKINNRLKFL